MAQTRVLRADCKACFKRACLVVAKGRPPESEVFTWQPCVQICEHG